MQYNNDIANERITGKAQAQADAIMGRANTLASTNQTNATNLANAINMGGKGFTDVINLERAYKQNLEMARYGWSIDSRVSQALATNDINELNNLKLMLEGSKDKAHIGLLNLINNKLNNK